MTHAATSQEHVSIDVVILNYNYGRFVGDAIESALGQTSPADQVIVVNDGSTDDSLDVIGRFGDSILLVNKPNSGHVGAAIAGLGECRSDYICFLDADDVLMPEALAIIRSKLITRPVKAQFQLKGVDVALRETSSLFPVFPCGYGSEQMIADNYFIGYYNSPPTSANVFRRDFIAGLDLSRIDPRGTVDGVPNLIAPYFGPVVSVNSPVALYRVHGKNASQWFVPSVDRLQWEVDRLAERWRQAEQLSGGRARTPALQDGLFALERRLMMAALTPGAKTGELGRRFRQGIGQAGYAKSSRLVLGIWSRLLSLPSAVLRRWLVVARRTPRHRPRWLNQVLLALKKREAAKADP